MPDWMRDVLIALGSFFGGRAANVLGSQINEGREMRRGLDRLTTAVESIGSDLRDIRGEIHSQVAGLKVDLHEQISGVRQELHSSKVESEARLRTIEDRVDSTNGRIDALAASENILIRRSTGQPERRAWERSCRLPGSDHDPDHEQTGSGSAAPR
jgi:hypothetical protein